MRILISGGTGMIGKLLVPHLHDKGNELLILTRSISGYNKMHGVKMIQWDGFSMGYWAEYMNQADVVINLAGENIGSQRWSNERKNKIIESRVNSGIILSQAISIARNRPRIFIQASAIGYYGAKSDGTLTEESPSGNDFLAEICKKWEASSLNVESMGMRRIIIRTGVVLSKEAGALNRILIPFNFFIGGPIGSGKQIISWIHPYDVVSAIDFLIEHEKAQGVFNLTAPQPISNAQLGKELAKIIRRPYWLPVPSIGLRLLLGEMSTLVLDGQKVIPQKLISEGFEFKYSNIMDSLSDLMA
jgi:uncharacterized protein (TIGR01777 family)